ncbi:MAG: polysaccharide biosynthesis tyrosine autokinase, partial [Pseudomonadota bacterium]
RESALEQSLSTLEGKSLVQSRKSVQLRQLQREADADRLIYENFLNRFRETSEQEELQDADARILNAAFPPQRASSPNRKKVVVLAAAAGLFLGILVVLMVERLNRGLRSAADLSVLTGRPVLASLPRSGFWRRRLGLLRAIKARPNAQLAEAVRKLRTSLFLSNVDRPPQVVMVTSAVAGEGKSTTALLFAHMTAQLGRSVILVDCDIRRPTLQDIAPPPVGGLVPALQRKVDVSDAICEMPDFSIHTLANRTASPQSADILSSDRFRDLIARLRQSYDMVVLDAPPVLAVADAAAIGHVADTCIYAVRWNKTPRQVVQHGLYQLTGLGVNVAGCVLTRADPVREARYSYSRYGYGGEAARNAYA